MNVQKSTRYALYAAMELAQAQGTPVTSARVAELYHIPGSVLAKVFQQLVREGLVVGTRGPHGGYRLARDPGEITMLEVLNVFEPRRDPDACVLEHEDRGTCDRIHDCRLKRVFDEVDQLVRSTFSSISLDTLAGRRTTDPGAAPGE